MYDNKRVLVVYNAKYNIHLTRNKEERRLWSLEDSTFGKLLNIIIILHA